MATLLFDIQTGVSGDMILGALFDLGLDFGAWKARMESLRLPDLGLSVAKVNKHGLMATRFSVHAPDGQGHRGLAEIRIIVEASELPQSVKVASLSVFSRLALVEAGIHGVPVESVHFHEVGALDAIVDVTGACLGFDMLGVDAFYTTPFTFGHGTVRSAHGLLAVPAPATVALSRGFPSLRSRHAGELCTPTGTALVTTFAKALPTGWTGVLRAHGYGAGTKDLPDTANVLRICLMDPVASPVEEPGMGVFQVECNLDNMAPELVGYAAERLFAAGCLDVWQEPIHMKKNRSAVKLSALVEGGALSAALGALAAETSTGGMRWFPVQRLVAAKGSRAVETPFGKVDLKVVTFPGQPPRYTPEFESCRAVAEASGAPLQAIYREATAAALRLGPEGGGAT